MTHKYKKYPEYGTVKTRTIGVGLKEDRATTVGTETQTSDTIIPSNQTANHPGFRSIRSSTLRFAGGPNWDDIDDAWRRIALVLMSIPDVLAVYTASLSINEVEWTANIDVSHGTTGWGARFRRDQSTVRSTPYQPSTNGSYVGALIGTWFYTILGSNAASSPPGTTPVAISNYIAQNVPALLALPNILCARGRFNFITSEVLVGALDVAQRNGTDSPVTRAATALVELLSSTVVLEEWSRSYDNLNAEFSYSRGVNDSNLQLRTVITFESGDVTYALFLNVT